ncbi:hypothetical protein [Streptomyces sp. NBC_01340]|uniref:hypothetical protein n=1 Tax=Streptomyces sp. NBC_01340 TaxID=2903830 RepID=UPI003DA65A7C
MSPVFSQGRDRSEPLASCYRESPRVAEELGAHTVRACPAGSAGRGLGCRDAADLGGGEHRCG